MEQPEINNNLAELLNVKQQLSPQAQSMLLTPSELFELTSTGTITIEGEEDALGVI